MAELFCGDVVLFVPRATDLPVVGERILEAGESLAAKLVMVEAMLHAFGDHGNDRVAGAEEKAEKRIDDKADEEEGDDDVSKPAPGRVAVPEEVPDFFEGCF